MPPRKERAGNESHDVRLNDQLAFRSRLGRPNVADYAGFVGRAARTDDGLSFFTLLAKFSAFAGSIKSRGPNEMPGFAGRTVERIDSVICGEDSFSAGGTKACICLLQAADVAAGGDDCNGCDE